MTSVSLAQFLKSCVPLSRSPPQCPWQFQPLMFQSQLLSHWSMNQSISEAGYCGNPALLLSFFPFISSLGETGNLFICFFFSEVAHHTAHCQDLCKTERRKYLSLECIHTHFTHCSTTLPLASLLLITRYLPYPSIFDPLCRACLCPSLPDLLTIVGPARQNSYHVLCCFFYQSLVK